MTALHEKVETVGIDAIQKFKTSQLFIDSCVDYYSTGFDDCLKQVVSIFPELDLSEISMDAPEPMTPARNVITNDDDGTLNLQLPHKADGGVVLAQLVVNPPLAPVFKIPVVTVDVDDTQPQRDGGTLVNAPNT